MLALEVDPEHPYEIDASQVSIVKTTLPPVTLIGQATFSRAGYVKTIERDGGTQRVYAGPTITFEGWYE